MLPLGGDAGPLGGDAAPLGGVGGLLEGLEDPERSVLLCVTPSALSLNLLSLKYISKSSSSWQKCFHAEQKVIKM